MWCGEQVVPSYLAFDPDVVGGVWKPWTLPSHGVSSAGVCTGQRHGEAWGGRPAAKDKPANKW